MAKLTAYRSLNMDSFYTWYGDVTIANNGQIQIVDGGYLQNYYGRFSYDPFGDLAGGELNALNLSISGVLQYEASGLTIGALTAQYYIDGGNTQPLLAMALAGADQIKGSAQGDILYGYDGDDRMEGAAGNDVLVGGAGVDTAIYGGQRADYQITDNNGSFTVFDTRAIEGVDTLRDIELFQFADKTLDLRTPDALVAIPPTVEMSNALIELYVAYFNRAPEAEGSQYWQTELIQQLKSGQPLDNALDNIAEQFWPAAQAFSHITGYTPNMSNVEFVSKVYSNVLGRPDAGKTDSGGIQYWVDKLESGVIESRGVFINDLLAGAHDYITALPNDSVSLYVDALFENRLQVSSYFSQNSVSGALTGDAAVRAGISALDGVTDDPATAQAAIQLIGQFPSDLI